MLCIAKQPTESVSEIFKICGDAKVAATNKLDYSLQIVFLLSSNSDLSILQLALDFEPLRLNCLNNLLRLISLKAVLNLQILPSVTNR